MSASLVGSEMCIRDRAKRALESCPAAASAALRCWGRTPFFLSAQMAAPCLLYTSDAADDM
eukprot:10066261-Alexandrium_andersonii.AAC.1